MKPEWITPWRSGGSISTREGDSMTDRKEWVPTEPGLYLFDGKPAAVEPDLTMIAVTSIDSRLITMTMKRVALPDRGWSIAAPDWQDGAPTKTQLDAWPWWLLRTVHGQDVIGGWFRPGGCLHTRLRPNLGGIEIEEGFVHRAAPVQLGWSNGPRWVPRSVTGGGR